MSIINFDATQVTPQQPLEAVPAGWYRAAVTESELVPTNDGSGMRLKYEMTIVDGPFEGRKVFDGFNLQNANPQAVEISQQQLSALCHATGVLQVADSSALHNIPVLVKVSFEPPRFTDAAGNTVPQAVAGGKSYDAQNRVKAFKNINDGEPTTPPPAAGGAAAPAGFQAPAWTTAKAATPAPAAAQKAPAAAATTSTATPPWLNKGAQAAPAAAAPAPAAAAPAKAPASPKKPAAPAAPADTRKFFVYISDDNMPLKTADEVRADLAAGMPVETPLLLEAEQETGDWKDAKHYGLTVVAAAVSASPTGGVVPPWKRK